MKTRPFRRALLASLLAHIGLFAALGQWRAAHAPAPAHIAPLQVRLQPARAEQRERPLPGAQAAGKPASTPTRDTSKPPVSESPFTPPGARTDWMNSARTVIREMHEPSPNPFLPPSFETDDGPGGDRGGVPAIAAALRSAIPRPKKLCGRIAEVDLGIRIITIPTTYACADRQDEFTNAPGAGRSINPLTTPDGE